MKKNHILYISMGLIILVAFYFRISFTGNILTKNEARLYTEAVRLAQGAAPQKYTSSWAPFFLSSWHGWLLPNLRALVYRPFPFLKPQVYLTVIFGILVVISTFRLGARLYDRKTGLLAAFLTAIVPIQASMSYGLSSEIPLTFFILETFIYLVKGVDNKDKKAIFISSLFLSCALLSKLLAILFIPAILFYFITNRGTLSQKDFLRSISGYFALPIIFWLTWAVPNFGRIFSNEYSALSSFVLNTGANTAKIGLIESHLFFLSSIGCLLLIVSLIYLIFSHKKKDIFLFFIVLSSVGLLNSFKHVMVYYYAVIVPFYLIAAARALVLVKGKALRYSLIIVAAYFTFVCIRTDIINIDLDFSGQNGCKVRRGLDCLMPSLNGAGVREAILELNKIVKENDRLYISDSLIGYQAFLKKKDLKYMSSYVYLPDGSQTIYNKNFLNELEVLIKDNPPNASILLFQDFAYYRRVTNKLVWRETDIAQQLAAAGFVKIYENYYPDDNMIKKSEKWFKKCLTNQWVKNYIYRK